VEAAWSANSITSPEEQDYLFASYLPFLQDPYPTKVAYDNLTLMVNGSLPGDVTLPYSGFVDLRFANGTEKVIGRFP
jgi:hypothetical protein